MMRERGDRYSVVRVEGRPASLNAQSIRGEKINNEHSVAGAT